MDSNQFWKLIKRRRKTAMEAGSEIKFSGETARDAASIVNGWGTYFKDLYTPSDGNNSETTTDQDVITEFNNLKNMQNTEISQARITAEEVTDALTSCNTGKACGDDSINYEHLMYSGPTSP